MYGICNLSLIPCRSQPFDKSEMVTQLLFGEHFKILEEQEKWTLIKIAYDGYECWIDKKQFQKISEIEYNLLNDEPQHLSMEIFANSIPIKSGQNSKFIVLLGSVLPNLKKKKIHIGENIYHFRGKSILSNIKHQTKQYYSHCKNVSELSVFMGRAFSFRN